MPFLVMKEGFRVQLTVTGLTSFEIIEFTPPAVDAGEAIDMTTHSNTAWETFAFRLLKKLEEAQMTVAYDIKFYSEIIAACGANRLITVTFPDGATLAFWGGLRTFKPSGMKAGERPTAQCDLKPTLRNSAGVETAPVFTAGPTTTTTT
jgi:hypothetical protein